MMMMVMMMMMMMMMMMVMVMMLMHGAVKWHIEKTVDTCPRAPIANLSQICDPST